MQTPSPFRQEVRQLALLIGPLLLSQLCQAAYGVIDTIMAGQVSPLDLAGVAMGSSVWLPLLLLVSGTLMATTPLVAEAWGAQRLHDIPHLVHQALWLALFIGLGGMVLLRHADPLFRLFDMPPRLEDIARRYLYGISFGMPALALFTVLRCYCEGLGRPLPITIISLLGLPLNALLNYLFIYGKLGLPAMGGAGCGWATGIALWCTLGLMTAYVLSARFFAPVRLLHERSRPEWTAALRFLRLGVPIGIAVFFEVSVFCVVTIVIGPLGERVVAGHQIAFSVTSLFFMLPLSLAFALTIRIGHAYGRRDLAAIRLTRLTGLRVTGFLAVVSGIFITLFRYPITALYTQDESVRALASDLLLFAAAYQVFDALQVAAAGCLRGIQDTRGPMIMTLVAYWAVALPVGYSLGLTLLVGKKLGPYGLWTGLVAGLFAACVLLNWRLRQQIRQIPGRWDQG